MNDSTNIDVSKDKIIDFLASEATNKASQAARDRVNFFFTFIGIFLALISLVAAGFVNYLFSEVTEIADRAARNAILAEQEKIESISEQISKNVQSSVEGQLRPLTLLPLLAAESIALDVSPSFSRDRADNVFALAKATAPAVRSMSSDDSRFVYERIEDAMDAFFGAGEIRRVLDLADLFDDQLVGIPGTYQTLANTFSLATMVEPNFVNLHNNLLSKTRQKSVDRGNVGLERSADTLEFFVSAQNSDFEMKKVPERFKMRVKSDQGFARYCLELAAAAKKLAAGENFVDSDFVVRNADRIVAFVEAHRE